MLLCRSSCVPPSVRAFRKRLFRARSVGFCAGLRALLGLNPDFWPAGSAASHCRCKPFRNVYSGHGLLGFALHLAVCQAVADNVAVQVQLRPPVGASHSEAFIQGTVCWVLRWTARFAWSEP